MKVGAAYRGQPLVALTLLIGGWVGLRMMMVQAETPVPAFAAPAPVPAGDPPVAAPVAVVPKVDPRQDHGAGAKAAAPQGLGLSRPVDPPARYDPLPPVRPARQPLRYDAPPLPPRQVPRAAPPIPPAVRLVPNPQGTETNPRIGSAMQPVPVRIAVAHQMLWMAALADRPLEPRAGAQGEAGSTPGLGDQAALGSAKDVPAQAQDETSGRDIASSAARLGEERRVRLAGALSSPSGSASPLSAGF